MQKWEYVFAEAELSWGTWCVRYENGQEIANWKKMYPSVYANEVGKRGWELVSVAFHDSDGGSHYYRLFFRRPVE